MEDTTENTTLNDLINYVAEIFIVLPETEENSDEVMFPNLITRGIHCFSRINNILFSSRLKELTVAKQEDIGKEISKILFYVSSLAYLLDIPSDSFNEESLIGFSEEFDQVYIHDAIMASCLGIKHFVEISEYLYLPPIEEETDTEDPPGSPTKLSSFPVSIPEEPLESKDDTTGPEQLIAPLFTIVLMICDRLELSFENLVYNASLLEIEKL